MPLRDHFRPPVEKRHSWDELHGGWPMVIVQQLYHRLPPGFVAAPNVHLGTNFEIDVSAYECDDRTARAWDAVPIGQIGFGFTLMIGGLPPSGLTGGRGGCGGCGLLIGVGVGWICLGKQGNVTFTLITTRLFQTKFQLIRIC